MTKDPVCGMQVDENNSEFQSQYDGKQYSFCSEDCKNKFEQNPQQFARGAA
ncbi:MAG TPA: YHS domain-containing protein [Terriglobales bacterium]